MANEEQLAILRQGVDAWNAWRRENLGTAPDLSAADLSGADLPEANLSGADLTGADLYRADLYWADLSGANLSGADLTMASLIDAKCSRANFSSASLQGALFLRTDLTDADLRGCKIHGISVWGGKGEPAKQENLIITHWTEPKITVDNLVVAQFIYLLLNNQMLRDVIGTVARKAVLLLGRFGDGGIEVLHAIAAKLREKDYVPIIFEFGRPEDRNYKETIKTLAGLSRFVIADLSGPSVPAELEATVPHFKIPFVPILEEGRRPYAMFADLLENDHVLKPLVVFRDTGELIEKMQQHVIDPAEDRLIGRQALLKELLPGS